MTFRPPLPIAIGDRIGRFVVVGGPRAGGHSGRAWLCRCECGAESWRAAGLIAKNKVGCGSCRPRRRLDIAVGRRFGRYEIVREVEPRRHRTGGAARQFLCRCGCGLERVVPLGNLTSGASKGCLSCAMTRHGMSGSSEYQSWIAMIKRCTDPSGAAWKNYGGRGIRVADEWIGRGGFERFLAHIGPKPSPKHSIDRINNDGNYEPGNVRWATRLTQARNRRRNLRGLTLHGHPVALRQIGEIVGLTRERVRQLVNKGLSPEDIIARGKRTSPGSARACRACGVAGHNSRTCRERTAAA